MIKLKLSTIEDLAAVTSVILKLDFSKAWSVEIKEFRESRSIPQNSLLHMWCSEISKFLIFREKKDWTPEFTKDALKHTFLGYEVKTRVNMETGLKREYEELRHTSDLDVSAFYFFMTQVEHWAIDKGCKLTIPENSEFMFLKQKESGN